MSASSLVIKEQEGDAPNDVLFSSTYGIRTIELNRPKDLNALNGSMARKIVLRLRVLTPQFKPKSERPGLTIDGRNGKNHKWQT